MGQKRNAFMEMAGRPGAGLVRDPRNVRLYLGRASPESLPCSSLANRPVSLRIRGMTLRIRSLPARGGGNPYVGLFYDALERHDVQLVGSLRFDLAWFADHLDTFDAVHLHWPEYILARFAPPWLERIRGSKIRGSWALSKHLERVFRMQIQSAKVTWFASVLEFLKRHDKKIIWTWHNLEPHEDKHRFRSDIYSVLAASADLIIFHSGWAEKRCREIYQVDTETVVMMHGNYSGVYPPPRERDVVAIDLGFDPTRPIVGCLGNLRHYKGIDVACRAIETSKNPIQFLCAGDPYAGFELDGLKAHFDSVEGSLLLPRRLSDQEFADFTNLCDIVLLPYRRVTGSGALLAALTLGRGVIASDLPFFQEILAHQPDAGRLVQPENPAALASEITEYLTVPAEVRQAAARRLAERFDWDQVIKPVGEAASRLRL